MRGRAVARRGLIERRNHVLAVQARRERDRVALHYGVRRPTRPGAVLRTGRVPGEKAPAWAAVVAEGPPAVTTRRPALVLRRAGRAPGALRGPRDLGLRGRLAWRCLSLPWGVTYAERVFPASFLT